MAQNFLSDIHLADDLYIRIGDSSDLFIYHEAGGASWINNYTSDLHIRNNANDGDIIFSSDDGAGGVTTYFSLDGGEATHSGSATTALYTIFPDNSRIALGTGKDLHIFHDGTNNQIRNEGGSLDFEQHVDDGTIRFYADNGSGGVARYFYVDGSTERIQFDKQAYFVDSAKATFGAGEDLQIYHNGSNSFIENDTGYLMLRSDTAIYLRSATGNEPYISCAKDGEVSLYYDDSLKFETTNTGVKITGIPTIETATASGTAMYIYNTTDSVANTKTLIDFRAHASDNSTFYVSGQMGSKAEGTWTSTSSTRDASLIFNTVLNGNNELALTLASDKSATFAGTGTFDGNVTISADGTNNRRLYVANGTDYGRAHIGRAYIGKLGWDDHAGFSHEDHNTQTNYAVLQNEAGDTFLNVPTNRTMYFRTNNSNMATMTSATATFEGNIRLTADIGRDDHNRIMFSTDDSIILRVADTHRARFDSTGLNPYADSAYDLGTSSLYWKDAYIDTITTTGAITSNLANGKWRINSYGAMYFRNSSNATHESYIHSRSDGSLSIGRVAESDWTGSGANAYAATTYDHLTFDTSSNATFAGQVKVTSDIFLNPDYVNANEYLYLRKHQSGDGGIIFQSKTSGGSTQSDFQIRNQGTTGDLKFYAYGLAGEALILDRENGNATFAGNITFGDGHLIGDDGDDNLLIQGSASENIVIDSADDIVLDADGGDIVFKDDTTAIGRFKNNSGNFVIKSEGSDDDLIFKGNDGGSEITALTLDMSEGGDATFARSVTINSDTGKLYLGADDDLHVYHTGSHGYVLNKTGALYIMSQVQDGNVVFSADNGEANTTQADYFSLDGGSATHDGSATTALYTKWPDLSRIALGSGKDLQLYHNGSNSYIENDTGHFYIKNKQDDGDILFQSDDGSGGTATYLTIDGGAHRNIFNKDSRHVDNIGAYFGTDEDMLIYHDGTNNFITSGAVGLYVQGDYPRIQSAAGENYFVANPNAGVSLYYDNVNRIETTSTGVTVAGDTTIRRIGSQTSGELLLGGTTDGGFVDFDGTSLQLNTQRDPNTGTFVNTSKSHASIIMTGASTDSSIKFYTTTSNNATGTLRWTIDKNGALIKNGGTSSQFLMADGSVSTSSFNGGTVTGDITIDKDAAKLILQDDSTGNALNQWISYRDNDGTERAYVGYGSTSNSVFYVVNNLDDLKFYAGGVENSTMSGANTTFANDVGMVTGHSSGKFAVMSSSVHGSYDFYNNGTSYFNGDVTIDANLTQTTGTSATFAGELTAKSLTSHNNRGIAGSSTDQEFPIGHFSEGEEVFSIDPTWTNAQLQNYFGSSSVEWLEDSTAPSGWAIKLTNGVNVGGAYDSGFPYIAIEEDAIYYMECHIRGLDSDTSVNHYMGSIDYKEDFTAPSSGSGNPGSYGYWVMLNANTSGQTWTKATGIIRGSHNTSTGYFETGAKYWTPQALFNYSHGAGTRACVISGWRVVKISKQRMLADGAVGTPSLTFAEDQDTGLYRVGSNQLSLVTGGSKVLSLSNGKVGINTTDPDTAGYSYAEDLVILGGNSASDGAGITIACNGKTYAVLAFGDAADNNIGEIYYSHSDNSMNFRTNTNVALALGSNGDVTATGDLYVNGGNIFINDTNTELAEGGGNAVRIDTDSGYVDIGPMNTSWSHFNTDRAKFYMNTSLTVDSGIIGSYDEDVQLQRAGTNFARGHASNLLNTIYLGGYDGADSGSSGRRVLIKGGSNDYLQLGPYDDNNYIYCEAVNATSGFYFNASAFNFDTGVVRPYTDNEIALGGSSNRWTYLYVSQEVRSSGDVCAYYSDERLKNIHGTIPNALDKVLSLTGFYYTENEKAKEVGYNNDKQQVGVSAQEVQKVLPEAVSLAPFDMDQEEMNGETKSKSGEDYLTVKYEKIVPLLIESIKELKAEIDELKKCGKCENCDCKNK